MWQVALGQINGGVAPEFALMHKKMNLEYGAEMKDISSLHR